MAGRGHCGGVLFDLDLRTGSSQITEDVHAPALRLAQERQKYGEEAWTVERMNICHFTRKFRYATLYPDVLGVGKDGYHVQYNSWVELTGSFS